MTKWFYHSNQIVKGPFSTEELKELIPTFSDAKKTLVWSRGYTEWIPADRWQPLAQPPQTEPMNTSTAYSESTHTAQTLSTESTQTHYTESVEFENTREIPTPDELTPAIAHSHSMEYSSDDVEKTEIPAKETPAEVEYRVQLNFVDQPQMTKTELMAFAGKVDDPSQIAIFDPETKVWKEIYAFREIVEKLGLTRRKHPRVPILAQFSGTTSRHEKFNARLVTISIGGLGLTDVFDLKVGDVISGQITSPHFYSPVTVEAEATYCGNDGYVGLKFVQINDDSQSLVTDYVKRFSNTLS